MALPVQVFQPPFLLQKDRPAVISAPAMPAADIDIEKVAKLSRLSLTPEEAAHYEKQLNGVLAYIDTLTAHDLGDVEPSSPRPRTPRWARERGPHHSPHNSEPHVPPLEVDHGRARRAVARPRR